MNEEKNNLIGKCGFFCGSCPTYVEGQCTGCRTAHMREFLKVFKIIPNGLEIKTKEDKIEKFVVNNRKVWVKKINETISLMNKGEKEAD